MLKILDDLNIRWLPSTCWKMGIVLIGLI